MQISNMINERGNTVKNQFILKEEGRGALGNFKTRKTFQSYNSIIAVMTEWDKKEAEGCRSNINIELDETYWNYSRTTSKYRCLFLGETTKETEQKLKDRIYQFKNLN